MTGIDDTASPADRGLDKIDLRILRVLQGDGRISNLKLAETEALSPTAVLARVQRLTREGFIVGYHAELNAAKHGRGLICLALDSAQVQRLGLPPMARHNESRHKTAFTVSIEAREVTPRIIREDNYGGLH